MATINLDEKRAQREPLVVTFGGEDFTAEHGIPLDFWDLATANKFEPAMSVLFGDEAGARFMGHKPTTEDMVELAKGLAEAVGFGELGGNPTRSPGGSSTTGRPSKRTSKGSTA